MANSTDPKPTMYRDLYENTGNGSLFLDNSIGRYDQKFVYQIYIYFFLQATISRLTDPPC